MWKGHKFTQSVVAGGIQMGIAEIVIVRRFISNPQVASNSSQTVWLRSWGTPVISLSVEWAISLTNVMRTSHRFHSYFLMPTVPLFALLHSRFARDDDCMWGAFPDGFCSASEPHHFDYPNGVLWVCPQENSWIFACPPATVFVFVDQCVTGTRKSLLIAILS